MLADPRIGFTKREINAAIQKISSFSQIVNPGIKLKVIKENPEDNKILECAVVSGTRYIVSGDKHLLTLKRYKGTKILSVAEMLEALGEK